VALDTIYIAQYIIVRLNGKNYEEGDEVTGLSPEQETFLLEKGIIALPEDSEDEPTGVPGENMAYVTAIYDAMDRKFEMNPNYNSLWEPPVMPDTFRNNGLVPDSYNPDVQLAAMVDPLVDGKYVTKRSIGKSSSRHDPLTPTTPDEIFDIWCYELTPEKYEKTILITSMIHGNEYTTFYWMAQFLDLIVNQWENDPHLAYLRKSVRIVAVPIANPYGHLVQTRYNINDVDCSRNFNYNWGTSLDEYNQGTAPWSENEAVAIRDLMAEIADETCAALDFHTTLSEGDSHQIIYFPRFLNNNVSPYLALAEELLEAGDTTAFASTSLPTLTNWGIFTHGFNSANPEFKNGLSGSTRSSAEMTRCMRQFGNYVMLAAQQPMKNKGNTISLVRAASFKFDHMAGGTSAPIVFGTSGYTSQGSKTAIKFKSKNEGIFEVDGWMIISVDQDCEISILPHLYQVESPDFAYGLTLDEEYNAIKLNMKAGQELPIPFQAEITCHKTNIKAANNTNERPQEITFQLRTKITSVTGTAKGSIRYIKGKAKMTPTTSGDRYQRYTLNPTTLKYPITEGMVYEF
jgi:Zinc carboxypeptidase